jgi:MoaA/NifB/PqqE/SkfB family radical SAM enzyme
MKSPHFCYEPWVGIDIDNTGIIRPCCKFNNKIAENWDNLSINTSSIADYKASKGLQTLKEQFLRGEKPIACDRCWKDENTNYFSKRQLDSQRWKNEFVEQNLNDSQTLLLTIPLSNICNLKCRICNPHNSSSWIKEFVDVYNNKVSSPNWISNEDTWETLLNISENLIELHLHGGEPFLYDNERHLEILSKIVRSKNSKKIRLHYSTNCTIFPDQKYWDIFDNLGWIDIQPSIDDIGKRFEYNRKNAVWNEVEDNLFKYRDTIKNKDNIQFSISTTVSVFTINYLDEFFDYLYKNNLPKPYFGRLVNPAYYRCSIFPESNRDKIFDKIKNSKHKDIQSISQWVLLDDSKHLPEFRNRIELHDNYRNESFAEVFPEINSLLF